MRRPPSHQPTPGGSRLRALRERAGLAQFAVEIEAELGSGYLQRVEAGKVAQPARRTVERILAALGARYGERREVLETFGYAVATPLPTTAEVAWARDACHRELNDAPFPAYLLDCATNLLAWNRYLPPLLGLPPTGPALARLTERPLLALWFDPTAPPGRLVAEPATLLPAMARALRAELRRHHEATWADAMLRRLAAESPLFARTWAAVMSEPEAASAARALVPLRLRTREDGLLQFRLAAEPFARDPRFRLVYLFPADAPTLERCATWAAPPIAHRAAVGDT